MAHYIRGASAKTSASIPSSLPSNEEGKEAELLAMEGSDDGMLAEVFADAPLM